MAKKISFAHIEMTYDFDTKEESEEFKREHDDKGWLFWREYDWGNIYSLVVHKPYSHYNPGW